MSTVAEERVIIVIARKLDTYQQIHGCWPSFISLGAEVYATLCRQYNATECTRIFGMQVLTAECLPRAHISVYS